MRVILFKFIIKITSWLSLKQTQKWATRLAELVWRWSEKQRRITLTNIRLCYPKLSPEAQNQLAKDSLIEAVKAMFELGAIWNNNKKKPLIQNIHGLANLEHALQQNQGVLLAAPHFGNWEALNLWLSQYPGFAFLYKPPDDSLIEAILLKNRGQGGAQQITADAKGVRQVFKVLKEKRILAILPDQQPKSGQGLFSEFMGNEAYTMTLFSKIAVKTRVPVVFAIAERLPEGRGFDLHFKIAPESIYQDTETSVNTVNQMIEDIVAINPAQYQWTYKRFSIQADGSKPYKPASVIK